MTQEEIDALDVPRNITPDGFRWVKLNGGWVRETELLKYDAPEMVPIGRSGFIEELGLAVQKLKDWRPRR